MNIIFVIHAAGWHNIKKGRSHQTATYQKDSSEIHSFIAKEFKLHKD